MDNGLPWVLTSDTGLLTVRKSDRELTSRAESQPTQPALTGDVPKSWWWTQIEGIGEATAQKIIADREANGRFLGIDDLLRVKGIGPKTLEKMRPFLCEPNE